MLRKFLGCLVQLLIDTLVVIGIAVIIVIVGFYAGTLFVSLTEGYHAR